MTIGRLLVLAATLRAFAAAASPATSATTGGVALYRTHCASCHGVDGRGDGPDAPFLSARPRDLRAGFLDRYGTEELVRRVLDGARLAIGLDPERLRARAADTEALVDHLQRLPGINWRLADRGQEIYLERCEQCHGFYGRPERPSPTARQPRDLSSGAFQKSVGDADLARTVRHGRHGMPAIPALRGDADTRALVAFVRVLSPGFELYSRSCASCHGDDGRPQHEFTDGLRRPTVAFDRGYFTRRDPERLRVAVWHMLEASEPRMPHFRGEVSEPSARAIVEWLRRTARP